MRKIRIATRSSRLALIQAAYFQEALRKSGRESELVTIESLGDINKDAPIRSMDSVGVFASTLNESVLDGDVDIAVHSAKDIQTFLPEGIEVSAVLPRGPVEDILISKKSLKELSPGSTVGTSSLRRKMELEFLRPDLKVKDIRGNIDTRISKYLKGEYDAIIIAEAAYKRLDLNEEHYVLGMEDFPPAANQGIIAATSRTDSEFAELMHHVTDQNTLIAFRVERSVLSALRLSCNDPVSVYAGVMDINRLSVRFYSKSGRSLKDFTSTVRNETDAIEFALSLRKKIPVEFGYRWE